MSSHSFVAWLLLLLLPSVSQQPVRDVRGAGVGAASIAGRVVSDESEPQPLRRVRVFLKSPDTDVERTTITDDDGAFVLAGLPAGRYTLGATKEGYVTVSHGARRPGSPGVPIVLRDKQAMTGLALKLPRGAVITGTLFDTDGEPLQGVGIRVLRYTYTGGERRLTSVYTGMASHITDDRGIYRIYGLAAGEYAIAAPGRVMGSGDRDVLVMTDAEIRRGLEELKQTSRLPPQAGDDPATRAADTGGQRVSYAPVFYPGTTVPSQAALVKVSQGEERREVDFQMQLVPVSTIRGTVSGGDRMFSPFMRVHLIPSTVAVLPGTGLEPRTASISRDGRFAFSNVPPGQYSVLANAPPGPASSASLSWASTDVVMDGQAEQELMLALQPALRVSGRVVFEGGTPAPDVTRVRVTLEPALAGNQVALATPPAPANVAGRFTIAGVTAGRYRLQAMVSGQPGWILKLSSIDGRDSLDVPFDLRSIADGAVLTFTNRASELQGTVRDGAGGALPGYSVVIFPSDRAFWLPGARRIQSVMSATDGSFTFRNLPAGEYLLGALADIEDGQWFDRDFLAQLTDLSVKITLGEGERKAQDLSASRDSPR